MICAVSFVTFDERTIRSSIRGPSCNNSLRPWDLIEGFLNAQVVYSNVGNFNGSEIWMLGAGVTVWALSLIYSYSWWSHSYLLTWFDLSVRHGSLNGSWFPSNKLCDVIQGSIDCNRCDGPIEACHLIDRYPLYFICWSAMLFLSSYFCRWELGCAFPIDSWVARSRRPGILAVRLKPSQVPKKRHGRKHGVWRWPVSCYTGIHLVTKTIPFFWFGIMQRWTWMAKGWICRESVSLAYVTIYAGEPELASFENTCAAYTPMRHR
jgi:hypothetical protein